MHHRALLVAVAVSTVLAAVAAPAHAAPPGPWDAFNLSPGADRAQLPAAITSTAGDVTDPQAVLAGRPTRLTGAGARIVLDFGQEVGGTVTLHLAGTGRVGLAFSESSTYIDITSDASTGGPRGRDGAIMVDVAGTTDYTTPIDLQRGGFRFLTLFLDSGGPVDVTGASVHFTAAPTMADPSDYANSFYSSDDLLNRIWYAGAYTVQTNTIAPTQGRTWPAPDALWANSGVVGVGDTILTDGAKRDRTVWPGDLGVSLPAAYASTGDTVSSRNALTTMYDHQSASGALPYSGPPLSKSDSDTYHMWTLSATGTYYDYTADKPWLDTVWARYKRGVDYISAKMGTRGLFNMTTTLDSSDRVNPGEYLEANVLLWHVLSSGSRLAAVEGDSALSSDYAARAAALKAAIDSLMWDDAVGLYKQYPVSTVHPQDGNSLALWYGMVSDPARAARMSDALTKTWTSYGAPTPENKLQLKTFPASFEVNAHFAAGGDAAGVELIRREWGFMLNDPLGTKSTFPEALRADGCVCSSYTSMSHGWAAGPTSALTEYVLGVAPTAPGGSSWRFAPHPADLKFAQGRLTTTHGPIDASWRIDNGHVSMAVTAPAGTTGAIRVPGKALTVWLDGRIAGQGDDVVLAVDGGTHTVEAHPTAQTGTVGGSVPATLALTLGPAASFGPFIPGVAKDYTAATTATVTSTAGDAALGVDEPGHLANGAFTLPAPLGVDIAPATWGAPVSGAPVAITFTQHIGASDPLRTGAYSKTLTFTLSTTSP